MNTTNGTDDDGVFDGGLSDAADPRVGRDDDLGGSDGDFLSDDDGLLGGNDGADDDGLLSSSEGGGMRGEADSGLGGGLNDTFDDDDIAGS